MNEQKISPRDHEKWGSLYVHSIFDTIQGEGPFTGHPATFIRLEGCNLSCPGCDTQYTGHKMHATPEGIVALLSMGDNELIVITGGEPFRQNITPLVHALLDSGRVVQIESNGTMWPGNDFPWDHANCSVVCSPKTGKIHPKTAARVHAYKYVMSHDGVATDGLPIRALGHVLGRYKTVARPPVGWTGTIYLNPMDEKDEAVNLLNVKAVAESVMEHKRYTMGVQLHKIADLA